MYTKYGTAQFGLKTILKVVFLNDFFILYKFEGEKVCMTSAKSLGPINKFIIPKSQKKSPLVANPQSGGTVPYLRKVRKSNKILSPQISGIAICGTSLRTAHPPLEGDKFIYV
jgi:hypothetical protein